MADDIFDTRFEGKTVELDDNRIGLGEEINIMEKDATIQRLLVGMGWDLNAFDADALDLDMSVFMLDKEGQTRMDEDFVFYNNMQDEGAAVVHNGDNRTGAGDGDDESISIDLNGISFEVMQLLFTVSIYKGNEKGQNLDQVRNAYIRVVNADNAHEIVRYEMDVDLEEKTETAMVVGVLNREGPKWHFKPVGEFIEGGLGELARRYGLIVNQE